MTDEDAVLDECRQVLDRIGIGVRNEHLGGSGGGLCTLAGKRVLFLDDDSDLGTRLETCVRALAEIPAVQEFYLSPMLRERVDALSAGEG